MLLTDQTHCFSELGAALSAQLCKVIKYALVISVFHFDKTVYEIVLCYIAETISVLEQAKSIDLIGKSEHTRTGTSKETDTVTCPCSLRSKDIM